MCGTVKVDENTGLVLNPKEAFKYEKECLACDDCFVNCDGYATEYVKGK